MAEAAPQTVLDQISQGHLQCPICCCRFKDPKMLDCLHSFCLNCLEEMMGKQKPATEKITCPVCKEETQVPKGGLQSLTSSFLLRFLVSTPTTICDCGEDQEATWKCLDCSDNLCQKCAEAHRRVKHTKTHQIVSMENWHKSQNPQAEQPITRMCTNHTDQALCFYCDTCDRLICSMCVALDHRFSEHSYTKIDDAINSFSETVDMLLEVFETLKPLIELKINQTKHARNRLQKKLVQARRDISAKAEAEILKIRNKAKILTEKIDKIGQERDSEYKKVLVSINEEKKRTDQILSAVALTRQADGLKLLELMSKVMKNIQIIEGFHFEMAKQGPSFIGVKCQDVVSNKDLGEVCLSEKWQLKKTFGKKGTHDGEFEYAADVACIRNGDIVVTDTTQKRVSLFTSTGQFKTLVPREPDRHQLKNPWRVAVYTDINDLLFVTDRKNVKVIKYEELHVLGQFSPSVDGAEGLSEMTLTDIALYEDRLAVADWGRKVITVHKIVDEEEETVHIQQLASASNNMIGNYLAMSNEDHLIFTNNKEKKLLCVDFKGNEVFNVITLLNGKPAKPTGVLCDDDGSIYVAVQSDKFDEVDEVQKYDSTGAFLTTVAQGLYMPLGMAFTPTGDVVVADKHSVKIFERM